MHEEFKPVPNFPAYRVSNLGRVQSSWSGQWVDLSPCGTPYLGVALCRGNGTKPVSRRVHCLVAESFIGPKPPGKSCVRHRDNKRKNNRADNLLWGSYKNNEDDKREHGTWFSRISNAALCAESVRSIREQAKAGISQKEIARLRNVSRPTITRVVNGSTWGHVT